MMQIPDAEIGRTYRSVRGWELLEELVDLDRMAGHAGEAEAADRLRDALVKAGAREARTNSFDVDAWWRGESTLEAAGREFSDPHEVIALPNSPAGTVSTAQADLGYGTPDRFADTNVADRIVLAS
jgi:Iap family predicted aminopeptidase